MVAALLHLHPLEQVAGAAAAAEVDQIHLRVQVLVQLRVPTVETLGIITAVVSHPHHILRRRHPRH